MILGKKSIGKNTPDKKSIGKVTKFAIAGALSSLGARLDIANPIARNKIPPKKDKNNILIQAKIFPWPIETSKTNTPISKRTNVCKIIIVTRDIKWPTIKCDGEIGAAFNLLRTP